MGRRKNYSKAKKFNFNLIFKLIKKHFSKKKIIIAGYYPSNYEVNILIPEFTCVCPRTGQPDFATIEINYIPNALIVELKSLKLYLQGFRCGPWGTGRLTGGGCHGPFGLRNWQTQQRFGPYSSQ